MHKGRSICNQLKAVRRSIAEENGIPLEVRECTYEGPCRGTCPRCEAEVRHLESELERRIRLGRVATVAGLALGLASCDNGASDNAPDTDDVIYTGEPLPPLEEADTVRRLADTAKPLWRAPEDSDIILGEFDVMPLAAVPDSEAVTEEGEVDDDEALFGVIAETEPEYPGGLEAMIKFVQDNLKYPQRALENSIQGKVYLTLVVEEDGSVSNVRVLRDIGGGCGAEAKRVVEMMPKWTPGKQSGVPVRTAYNLPVSFVLPEDRPRLIEGAAPEVIYEDHSKDIKASDVVGPSAPTQQMDVEGVKLIVK